MKDHGMAPGCVKVPKQDKMAVVRTHSTSGPSMGNEGRAGALKQSPDQGGATPGKIRVPAGTQGSHSRFHGGSPNESGHHQGHHARKG